MAKAASISSSSQSFEALAIGIDIGGTGTKFGIVDRNGNVLFSSEISTRGHSQVEGFIDELYKHLAVLIEQAAGQNQVLTVDAINFFKTQLPDVRVNQDSEMDVGLVISIELSVEVHGECVDFLTGKNLILDFLFCAL